MSIIPNYENPAEQAYSVQNKCYIAYLREISSILAF